METNKKTSALKIISITAGVIILIIVIAVSMFLYIAHQNLVLFNTNDKPIVMALADNFISDINQSKTEEAAMLADPKYISWTNLSNDLIAFRPVFAGYEKQDDKFLSQSVKQFNDGKEVTYRTIAYFSDNTQGVLSVVAAQEDGKWKLEGINIDASPSHLSNIVMRGDEVDPILQNTIINAYEAQRSIYTSGDLKAIRAHMLLAIPAQKEQVINMSDVDLKKINDYQVQMIDLVSTSTAVFRSHDAVWTFNKDKTTVVIKLPVTATSTSAQTGNVGEVGSYSNGQWYF